MRVLPGLALPLVLASLIACGAEPRQPAPVDLGDLRDAAPEPSVTVPSLDAGTLAVATPEVRFDPVLSTPENALRSLIIALSLGSRNAFSRVCTQAGLASVDEVVDPSRWKTVAEAWVRDPPRWIRRDANSSEAHVGPEVKAAVLFFVRERGAWRLERLSPGR